MLQHNKRQKTLPCGHSLKYGSENFCCACDDPWQKTKFMQQNPFDDYNITVTLINKELEKYHLKYTDIKNDPEWFAKYTATPQECEAWEKWGTKLIMQHVGVTEEVAKNTMSFFNLNYGLREET